MPKYYELYKLLIVATAFGGVYIPSIEDIYGRGWFPRCLKVIFILPGFFIPAYSVVSVKYLLVDEGHLGNKVYSVVQVIYSLFSGFIVHSFYLNRKEFAKLFELWDSLFQEDLFPEDRQELLRQNRRMTNGWLKVFGSTSVFSTLIYSITAFLNPEKELSHPSGIPYRHASPDFELLATFDLIITVYGFVVLITYDCMMMVFLSLEEAEFQHLKNSLKRITDTIYVTDSGEIGITDGRGPFGSVVDVRLDSSEVKGRFEEVEKNLRVWISQHHQALRFHGELQKIYFYPLSVKFLVFVLIICLCSFLAVTGRLNLPDICICIVFCCSIYATFYVNIKYADSTRIAADTVFEEAFGGSWYLFPRNLRTAFHIIVMRSHIPVQYLALRIYPLSSRSFLRIMSSAYSFFTFLLHINRVKY